MTPCFAVDITTPQKYELRGLWFGPKKAERCIVWVHGLGSSAFSMQNVVRLLADERTAVLTFNNRGHDVVAMIPQKGKQTAKRPKRMLAGAAHEKFADCVDDIQGAIDFARTQGSKKIFIAGHSTGCQKSFYWAYKKKGRGVSGIILVAPVNDYAGAIAWHGAKKVAQTARFARSLVSRGKKHELLPSNVWDEEPDDAQRFLSLYTPDSVENIFSYDDSAKMPRIVRSVKVPVLVVWAAQDEYADRPPEKIQAWFETSMRMAHNFVIVPNVGHSFRGGEKQVARAIRAFMRNSDSW